MPKIRTLESSSLVTASMAIALFPSLAYGDVAPIVALDRDVANLPGVAFRYGGQGRLDREETEHLLSSVAHDRAAHAAATAARSADGCPDDSPVVPGRTAGPASEAGSATADDWQIVFLMRISAESHMGSGSTTVTPGAVGAAREQRDYDAISREIAAGTFTPERLEQALAASGSALRNSPREAMAYVAALGSRLHENYGESYAGRFVTTFEQYGRLSRGESVGQCSDIHYAMLRAYNRMVGPNAKAYLVNFQSGRDLHHTDMVIELDGQVYVVDYGSITQAPASRPDPLRQDGRMGHGLAYRIFGEGTEQTDRMLAHIESPLGNFLHEVSTGRSPYNPFAERNYSNFSAALQNQEGSQVRVFFGELGGTDLVMGVAANLRGIARLPAGFSLEGHVSGAIAYAYRNYQVDGRRTSLNSEILYVHTGLGIISPRLQLGPVALQARTDLSLVGGVWYKHFEGAERNWEGDGNLVSRTGVTATYEGSRVRVQAQGMAEIVPSFTTAFPSSTDGSSGMDGLSSTLSILPNRIQGGLDLTLRTGTGYNPFVGGTYQYTPLGQVGEARAGVVSDDASIRASMVLRGAFDRDSTPVFVPGARRELGATFNWCNQSAERLRSPVCLAVQVQKSLEDPGWSGTIGLEVRY